MESEIVPDAKEILPLDVNWLCYDRDGQRLVDGISFVLEAGSCSVLLGPNGSGKSLTLRLCHGLLQPSAGSVRWLGPAAENAAAAQAMVFQRPILLRRSVAANVEYALRRRGLRRDERKQRVEEVLAQTGLSRCRSQPAQVLSAGEQQRVALARAWALQPRILFLDEPTASVDPAATRAVETVIHTIRASGTKIVMATHDLHQAQRMADEVLFLYRGQLLEQTPMAEFFEYPRSREARAFLRGELLW